MTGVAGTCRCYHCPEPAGPGELCKLHLRPVDPDLERDAVREAGWRRIG